MEISGDILEGPTTDEILLLLTQPSSGGHKKLRASTYDRGCGWMYAWINGACIKEY